MFFNFSSIRSWDYVHSVKITIGGRYGTAVVGCCIKAPKLITALHLWRGALQATSLLLGPSTPSHYVI